jgi:Ran GTPase-activating protein (RanGAP) involved in mRNA processing and transport
MRGTKRRAHTFLLRELLSVLTEGHTIVDLDVSDNRLGNEGLSELQKFVASSHTFQTLSFDGSKPTNVGSLLRLFSTLAGRKTLN